MKVSDLLDVTSIWSLADLDTGVKALTLSNKGTRIAAHFQGSFCDAIRIVPGHIGGLENEIAIDGGLLRNILSVLPEEQDITASVGKGGLRLNCAGLHEASLRYRLGDTPPYMRRPPSLEKMELRAETMRDALGFLQGVVVEGVAKAILTGVRFSPNAKGMLTLSATDGNARVGVVPFPSVSMNGIEPFVSKTADLQVALDYFDTLSLACTDTHIYLSGPKTRVRLSLLKGIWPSFKTLPREFKYKIDLSPVEVATAAKAAVYLDSNALVRLVVNKKQVSFFVEGQEMGTFLVKVGQADVGDVDILLDARWLESASRLGPMTLRYNDAKTPVLFQGTETHFTYWMSPSLKAR